MYIIPLLKDHFFPDGKSTHAHFHKRSVIPKPTIKQKKFTLHCAEIRSKLSFSNSYTDFCYIQLCCQLIVESKEKSPQTHRALALRHKSFFRISPFQRACLTASARQLSSGHGRPPPYRSVSIQPFTGHSMKAMNCWPSQCIRKAPSTFRNTSKLHRDGDRNLAATKAEPCRARAGEAGREMGYGKQSLNLTHQLQFHLPMM